MTVYTAQQAHDDITALFDAYYDAKKAGASIPPNKRIESADAIVEQYVEQHGQRPPNAILSRLATYILLDTLSDSHPDKMAREEYPIMSYGQTGRHFERNIPAYGLQYDSDDVRGYVKNGLSGERNVLFDADTSEVKTSDWRMFLDELLTERESFIIRKLYEEGATQSEIAEELGVSQPRVAVIITGIYNKLSKIIGNKRYKFDG